MYKQGSYFIDIEDLEFVASEGEKMFNKLKGQNILIIGPTSFVGMWITESILYADEKFRLGVTLTLISRNKEKTIERYEQFINSGKIIPIYKKLQDVQKNELFDIHQVINLATYTDNSSGSSQLLENIKIFECFWNLLNQKTLKNVLFTSSGAVYGKNQTTLRKIKEDEANNFNNYYSNLGYGLGKFTSEFIGFEWAKRDKINFKVARLFSFSGAFLPLSSNYIIGNFVKSIINDDFLIIKNPGKVYRSFLYGADMALWLWKILVEGENTVYNVGSDQEITTIDLARLISKNYYENLRVLFSTESNGIDESYVPNIDKLKNGLNVEIKHDLNLSIMKMINWNKKYFNEKSI